MNYQGSFWVRCDDKCFYSPRVFTPQLTIVAREEYANISENKLITRILLEKYANKRMAIYLSAKSHKLTCSLFTLLAEQFSGYLTILANYGPISLNASIANPQLDLPNFEKVLIALDQIESIYPTQTRDKLLAFIQAEQLVEH